jgi:hypothetical protein
MFINGPSQPVVVALPVAGILDGQRPAHRNSALAEQPLH